MPARPRPLSFEMRPSPELGALFTLRRHGRLRTTHSSAVFLRAVEHETRRLAEPLAMIESCLDWLLELGVASAPRESPGKTRREPSYAGNVRVAVDLTRLAARVAREGTDAGGPWHAAAFALRTLLETAHDGSPVAPHEPRLGTRGIDARAAAALLDSLLRRVGCEVQPQTSTSRSSRGSNARSQRSTGPTKTTKATTTRAAKAANEQRGAVKEPAKPAAKRAAAPKPAPAPAPRARTRASTRTRTAAPGFGGLPDDAEPATRSSAQSPLGPRGITLDAEFFLEHAEITQWPCSPADLERGRKRALVRLHPDRMGEAATALFQRATRGHTELAHKLASTPKGVTTPQGTPRPAPVAPPPPPRSPVGEWPPRAARTA